ncbi:MAG: hypothetical protein WA783_11860 [Phormidesmis sp.]
MVSRSASNEGLQSATTAPELSSQTLPIERPLQRQPVVKKELSQGTQQGAQQGAPKQRTPIQWTSFKKNNRKNSSSANAQSENTQSENTRLENARPENARPRDRQNYSHRKSDGLPENAGAVDALAQLPGSIVLPPFRSQTAVSQRHEVNPAIAMNLLQDLQSVIVSWQKQLRQLVTALHSLHAQGPMVEGWLESSADVSSISGPDATLLRHGDTDAIMRYIDALTDQPQMDNAQQVNPAAQVDLAAQIGGGHEPRERELLEGELGNAPGDSAAPTQYRLCSLDENGQLQSYPCPPEQMGALSLAIARYQKFKQLMSQKRALNAKLQKAVDQLTEIRVTLQQEQ